jgi:sirohydrochlorin ferrochelatase
VKFLPWATSLLAGTLAGAVACAAFVVRRSRLAITGAVGVLAVLVLAAGVVHVWTREGRPDAAIASFFIALGAAAGGYALASEMVSDATRRREPEPEDLEVAEGASIGVVLLADAEAAEYRPGDVTRELEALERAEVPLPPHPARPFVYSSERARYRAADGSPARASVSRIAAALSECLREQGITDTVEVAFCAGGPSAAEAAARVARRSGRRIVIASLTVARTPPFDAAAASVHALDPSHTLLTVEPTEPLWASHALAVRAAERAFGAFGDDGIVDGVVLVAQGNPWQFDRLFPGAMEQTTYLTQRIRAELIEAGLPAERVRQAWLDWEEPDVPEAVRHLAALGASHVALVPVDMLYRSLATAVDLRMAADRAFLESGVRVALVEPLEDDPALISALRRSIVDACHRIQADERPTGG